MKFKLTINHLSRSSRRRMGKAREEEIDTDTHPGYYGLTTPLEVEQRYEELWEREHPGSHSTVKVIDTREIVFLPACKGCGAVGFAPSGTIPGQCEFCDGTFNRGSIRL